MCNWTFSLRGAHMRNLHRPSSDSTAPRSCGILSVLEKYCTRRWATNPKVIDRAMTLSIRISPKTGSYFSQSIRTVRRSHYLSAFVARFGDLTNIPVDDCEERALGWDLQSCAMPLPASDPSRVLEKSGCGWPAGLGPVSPKSTAFPSSSYSTSPTPART